MKWLYTLIAISTLVSSADANQRTYVADMHESQWTSRSEKLFCELTHIIPRYGVARFKQPAGEEIRFEMSTFNASNQQQNVNIDSTNPEWRFLSGERNLGNTNDNGGNVPFGLNRGAALRLLYELENGMRPIFTYKDAADATEVMNIGLSSVNFREAHRAFNHCVAELLPFGFDDVNFTKVNFEFNSDQLNSEMRENIDRVIKFVKHDSTARRIIIGGHTDWVGTELYNDDLSRFRTYRVLDYLTNNGIPESMIEYAAYGEIAPIATNETDRGRAANRRVTLQIIRDDDASD